MPKARETSAIIAEAQALEAFMKDTWEEPSWRCMPPSDGWAERYEQYGEVARSNKFRQCQSTHLITCTSTCFLIQVIPTFTKKIFIQPSFRTCGSSDHLARRGQATLVEGARGTARDGTKGGQLRSPLWIDSHGELNPQKLGYAITMVTYVDMNIYIYIFI